MTASKRGTHASRLAILGLCVSLPFLWSASVRHGAGGAIKAWDFGGVYYGARCAMRHVDPYDAQSALRVIEMEKVKLPKTSAKDNAAALATLPVDVYPPTALFLVAPLAILPWQIAQTVWAGLITVLMMLAAYLAWDLAAGVPMLAGCMAGFMLLNCLVLLVVENPSGVVIPLCVIAVWCLLKARWTIAGAVLLALSLVIKPHIAGFVWLSFVLAGGATRKRALQALGIAVILGFCAAVWIAQVSPHWIKELGSNVALDSARGGVNDPGPSGFDERGFSPVICMQSAVSVFRDDPVFYNPASYLIAGIPILIWGIAALRKRPTREGTLLSLAAISILTMLPVYHRAEDAKLLMLAIPGCALLWAAGGVRRWVALVMTAAAIVVTSDIPIIAVVSATAKLPVSAATLGGKLTLLALQPAPLVLLAAGCFYLWVYVRYDPEKGLGQETSAEKWLDAALAE